MTNKMDPEIKQLWLNALRSGEYSQAMGRLKRDGAFCCLGVLCEIAVANGVIEVEDVNRGVLGVIGKYGESDESSELPFVVAEWAGLDCPNPWVEVVLHDGTTREFALSDVNDDLNKNFLEIADLIEEQL